MLKGQIEKCRLYRRYCSIEALGNCLFSNIQSFLVRAEGFCGVAADVTGELIKQEDQCEGAVWRLGPIVEGCGSAGDDDERAEVGGDLGVKFVRWDEPARVGVARIEPEREDTVDVGVGGHGEV